jgi:hypothetical protein
VTEELRVMMVADLGVVAGRLGREFQAADGG